MNQPIRVLIVHDRTMVREGLQILLDDEPTIAVVGEASSGVDALRLARRLEPDVVLLNLEMSEIGTVARLLRASCPATQIIALDDAAPVERQSEAMRPDIVTVLCTDVSARELRATIRAVDAALSADDTASSAAFAMLTAREREVLRLIARGHTNKQIAAALTVTEGTVKGHVSAVLAKLQVADRTQAALYAVQHGLG